jgi:hypothetical protein
VGFHHSSTILFQRDGGMLALHGLHVRQCTNEGFSPDQGPQLVRVSSA